MSDAGVIAPEFNRHDKPMGHAAFFVLLAAMCLLWTAACTAASARCREAWPRRLLAAIALVVPLMALWPVVTRAAFLAFEARLETNWFAPAIGTLLAAVVGGGVLLTRGLATTGTKPPAALWPVRGLFAGSAVAAACVWGTLLAIDNAVVAEARGLRAEAATALRRRQPVSVAAADDAAPLYRQALAALAADGAFPDGDTEPDAEETAAALARHAATLDLLREAADRPQCRFAHDWSRPSLDLDFSVEDEMRSAAWLLAAAARAEAKAGDPAAALGDMLRIGRMSRHVAGSPALVPGMIGIAIDGLALELLPEILARLRPADAALLDDAALVEWLAAVPTLERQIAGEKAAVLTAVADIVEPHQGEADPPAAAIASNAGDGLPLPESNLVSRCFLFAPDLRATRDCFARLERLAAAGPGAVADTEVDRLEAEIESRRPGLMCGLFVPAAVAGVRAPYEAAARRAAAAVLVAAARKSLAGADGKDEDGPPAADAEALQEADGGGLPVPVRR